MDGIATSKFEQQNGNGTGSGSGSGENGTKNQPLPPTGLREFRSFTLKL